MPYYKNMAEVKEEIIEYNLEMKLITRYCLIVERAQNTLQDLLNIWTTETLREQKFEWFTPEKLTFYYYQSICALVLMH